MGESGRVRESTKSTLGGGDTIYIYHGIMGTTKV